MASASSAVGGGGEHVAKFLHAQRFLRGEQQRFQNEFQFHVRFAMRFTIGAAVRLPHRFRVSGGEPVRARCQFAPGRRPAFRRLARRLFARGGFRFRRTASGLRADELLEADQFEQRQKGADDFGAAGDAFKQFGEPHAAALGKHFQDELDLLADGPFVLENVARGPRASRTA